MMAKRTREEIRYGETSTRILRRLNRIGISSEDQHFLIEAHERLTRSPLRGGPNADKRYKPGWYAPSWNSVLLAWGVVWFDQDAFTQIADQAEELSIYFSRFSAAARNSEFYSRIATAALLGAIKLYMEDNLIDDPPLASLLGRLLVKEGVEDSYAWHCYLEEGDQGRVW